MIFPTAPLSRIDVPTDRARDYDPDWAEALAAMIKTQGLLQPILVRCLDGNRYRLVAGLYRLRAFELLGLGSIPIRLSRAETDEAARLDEVMENLGRHDLIALDRCHHLYELKRVWEATRARPLVEVLGVDGGKSFSTPSEPAEVFGFARSVAEKVGLTKQAINLAVKIWADLAPEVRTRLVGSDLARKQTELKALSEQSHVRQGKILDLIFGHDHPAIENVAAALAFLERGIAVSPVEKQFRAVDTAFAKLSDAAVDMVTSNHADRIIASLKRLGRI